MNTEDGSLTREERAFARDLIEIMKKHGVEIDYFENYDGDEGVCGHTYYFKGKNIHINVDYVNP